MSNSDEPSSAPTAELTSRSRLLLFLWLVLIVGTATLAGYNACERMLANRVESAKRHADRLDPTVIESGVKPEDLDQSGAEPVKVHVGVYVDRIPELSIKDVYWVADFYVWFRWEGNEVDPGRHFEIIDGEVVSEELQDEYVNGDSHYQLYRVNAKFTKFFDVTRFPLDDHMLTINIECPEYLRTEMVFVPDYELCKISSRVRVTGYEVQGGRAVEKAHGYRSTRGDPRLPEDYHAIYSQFRFGITLHRDGWGFYFKLFQGLYASLAIALTAFFIKPTDVDPRFGLGVGAFFASIANTYITSALIPDTGVLTLADTINGMGMVLIFLTVVQSTISLYIYDIRDNIALSNAFDKVSIVGFILGTIAVNAAMPLVAYQSGH